MSTTTPLLYASDADLVRAAARGEDSAIAEMYGLYGARLVRALQAHTGDPVLAQDLAQEALLRALDRLQTFDRTRRLWPWLRRIGINLAIDAARRAPPQALPLADEMVPLHARDDFETAQLRWTLDGALGQIAPRQRDALLLRYYYGFDAATSARRLGITRPAFDQLLFRARAALRREYLKLTGDRGDTLVLAPLWTWAAQAMLRARGRCRDVLSSLATGTTSVVASVSEATVVAVLGVATVITAPGHVASAGEDAARVRPFAESAVHATPADAATPRAGHHKASRSSPPSQESSPRRTARDRRRASSGATETSNVDVRFEGESNASATLSVQRAPGKRHAEAGGGAKTRDRASETTTRVEADCGAGTVGATSCLALEVVAGAVGAEEPTLP